MTDKLEPFFGVELKPKMLRVYEAAQAFGLAEKEVEMLRTPHTYMENLPKSEKALRGLLKKISGDPKKLARPASDGQPFLLNTKEMRYLPPIERPAKILCIGLNYRDHCEEQNKPIPEKPVVFTKFATSLVGHEQDLPLPLRLDKSIDYEAEFAIVIGKKARRVTRRTAMRCVGGYTIVNDVSARSIQASEKQWTRAKGFDNSCPCGPIIVTPDEIPDPHNLGISCVLNGNVMQRSNTSNLVFDVPYLISFISQAITLEPGDIISTGTCGGVGVYRDPQVFMKEGDIVEVKIERIGTLRNKCVKG